MDSNENTAQSHYISNNYFKPRSEHEENQEQHINEKGSLGGEITAEIGFRDLASAREYLEQSGFWNSEERSMAQEEMHNQKQEDDIISS